MGTGGAQGSCVARRCTVEMHEDVTAVGTCTSSEDAEPSADTRGLRCARSSKAGESATRTCRGPGGRNCDDEDRGAMGLCAGHRPLTTGF